jgi:transposase
VANRFYRWRKAGIWQQVWEELMRQAEAQGQFDWLEHYLDASIIRAHPPCGGQASMPPGQRVGP